MPKINMKTMKTGLDAVKRRLKTTGRYIKDLKLKSVLQTHRHHVRTLLWMSFGFSMAMVMCLYLFPRHTNETARAMILDTHHFNVEHNTLTMLGMSLSKMDNHLTAITQLLDSGKPMSQKSLAALKDSLSQLQQNLLYANQNQSTLVQKALGRATFLIQHETKQINAKLAELLKATHSVKYLPAKTLPFQVQYIENIQGQDVVSVEYHHLNFPLMAGEQLAGFRLVRSDFNQQSAIFKNAKAQQVRVRLSAAHAQVSQ